MMVHQVAVLALDGVTPLDLAIPTQIFTARSPRGLVAAPHRDGGQAQYVPAPVAAAGVASLSGTREWALYRLGEPLTLPVLARHASLSQRTFMRRFAEERVCCSFG